MRFHEFTVHAEQLQPGDIIIAVVDAAGVRAPIHGGQLSVGRIEPKYGRLAVIDVEQTSLRLYDRRQQLRIQRESN